MNSIILEVCNGERIFIDGQGYSREDFDNLSVDDLCKIRDRMFFKLQSEFSERKDALYNTFKPYIRKADIRKEKEKEVDKRALALMIRRMPQEDVIAVFTIYFDEILNKKNGDNEKNE